MTKLTRERTIKRETASYDRRRLLVVELLPHAVTIRVKGTREIHTVPWDAVLDLGRKLDTRLPERRSA